MTLRKARATKSHAATSSRQRNASSSQEARRFGGRTYGVAMACPDATKRDASVANDASGPTALPTHQVTVRIWETQQQARGLENTRSNASGHHDPKARAARRIQMPRSESLQFDKTSQAIENVPGGHEARPSNLPRPIKPAALQTHQVTVLNRAK